MCSGIAYELVGIPEGVVHYDARIAIFKCLHA
jgi:hypothetical protein